MRYYILLLIFLLVFVANAQLCWQEDGAHVYNNANPNWYRSAIGLSDGNFIFVWSDAESGHQQVKAMKINAAGEFIWDEPVILKTSFSYKPIKFNLIETENGVAVAWFESNDSMVICCQLIDLYGQKLWGDNGFSLSLPNGETYSVNLSLTEDNSDGFYISWSLPIVSSEIRILHFDFEGEIVEGWQEEGNLVNIGESSYYKYIYADLQGGLFLVNNHSNSIENNISLQRIDYNGNLLWGDENILCELPYGMQYLDVSVDDNGFNIFFLDENHLLYNTMDENGIFLYSEPQYLFSCPEFSSNIQISFLDGAYFIIWLENGMLKAQKYVMDQGIIWQAEGITLLENVYEINYQIVKDDYNGGFYISIGDYYYDETGIRLQHVCSDGNPLFTGSGYLIDSLTNNCYYETIGVSSSGVCGFFWKEYCYDENIIKVQMVSPQTGLLLEDDGLTLLNYSANYIDCYKFDACSNYSFFLWQSIYDRYVIYGQILENTEGEKIFTDAPLKIVGNEDKNFSISEIIYDEQEELLYLAFNFSIDNNIDNHNFGIQAIDLQGNRIFGNEGLLAFPEGEGYMSYKTVFQKKENDYLLLFNHRNTESNEENFWKLQRFNNSGFVWDEPVFLCESSVAFESVNWCGEYLGWAEDNHIKILKFDENGEIDSDWNGSAMTIDTAFEVKNLKAVKDDENNLILLWNNFESYNMHHLMGQKINSNGDLLWGDDGVNYCDAEGNINNIQLLDNHFYFVEYSENTQQNYLRKFDYLGNWLWSDNVEICDSQIHSLQELKVYNDQILAFYQLKDNNQDIMMKMFNSDGELLPYNTPADITICSELGNKEFISAIVNPDGSVISCWLDERDYLPYPLSYTPGCYAQKIDLHTLSSMEEEITPFLTINNYPNPFSKSTCFELPEGIFRNDGVLDIYNIKGQHIESIKLTNRTFEWNPEDLHKVSLSSSIYLYKIHSGQNTYTGKMLYLRRSN